ncbi:MAG: hypothetical protein IJ455_02430 [Agathobacter sp.]|nr:hypothetical protein [Agathobacter sp.]
MTINDAKKVMLDKVNLDIEAAELIDEMQAKEKQIKKLCYWAEEMQMQYDDLTNSGMRMFFLGLIGKKEARLQEAENEVRKKQGELSAARFELESLTSRVEDIEQTRTEIESVCNECLKVIEETDDTGVKNKLLAISELPKLRAEITDCLSEVKPLFTTAYAIYGTRTGRPTSPGTYINKDSEMRKHSRVIAKGVNHIIELLNTYNLYAPEEIQIEFHAKWMEKEGYWEEQQMAYDTMERIKKVEEWFCQLDNCWRVMSKQQKAVMQKLQEEVLAYLDD